MALASEQEKVAVAIGETMVGYEYKIAIAHSVGMALFDGPPNGPHMNTDYLQFRQVVLEAHKRVKASFKTPWKDKTDA